MEARVRQYQHSNMMLTPEKVWSCCHEKARPTQPPEILTFISDVISGVLCNSPTHRSKALRSETCTNTCPKNTHECCSQGKSEYRLECTWNTAVWAEVPHSENLFFDGLRDRTCGCLRDVSVFDVAPKALQPYWPVLEGSTHSERGFVFQWMLCWKHRQTWDSLPLHQVWATRPHGYVNWALPVATHQWLAAFLFQEYLLWPSLWECPQSMRQIVTSTTLIHNLQK